MTSVDVARVAVQAAHVDGIKKGTLKVAGLSFFGVAVIGVAAVAVVVFLNHKASADKKDEIFLAENHAFSHGVKTAHNQIAEAQKQNASKFIV